MFIILFRIIIVDGSVNLYLNWLYFCFRERRGCL